MSLLSFIFGGGPKAPDPVATAQAQNQVNKDALITAAQLNQVNQTGPMGSVTYSGDVGSPNRTQTTTLSPELQQLLQNQTGASNSLTNIANQRLAGAPQGDFKLGPDPEGYIPYGASSPLQQSVGTSSNFTTNVNGGPIATSFDGGGSVATGYDSGGSAQRNLDFSGAPALNTDFNSLTQQAQDAQYAKGAQYLDPQFAQSDQQLESRLAAQGITQGSDAYNNAMGNAARQKQSAYSDLRNSAILQGDQLQSQLFGQNLAGRQQAVGETSTQGQFSNAALAQQYGMNQGQAQFQNQAQAQQFGQNLGQAQFQNQAQAQNFDQGYQNAGLQNQAQNDTFAQNLSAADFGNQAMGQQFQQGMQVIDANNAKYQQNISNDVLARNQNINEAMSYLNGTPISPQLPSYQPIGQSTAAQAAPDSVGLAGSNYNAASQARAAIMGSIFGAAGSAAGACWVAREVYGNENPEWLAFREWLFTYAPKWFKRLYLNHGERFAAWIKTKPALRDVIRSWMTARINACA